MYNNIDIISDGVRFVKYQGFWCALYLFRQILSSQKHFKAKDSDIILASLPKSGTTCLKSLTFSTVHHNINPNHDETLFSLAILLIFFLTSNSIVIGIKKIPISKTFKIPGLTCLCIASPSPSKSKCRIIYICGNPLDMFIPYLHFSLENKFVKVVTPVELDEAFDIFCRGINYIMGPFWDHVLGFWTHLENPRKDIGFNVKKIAEFLECRFSLEEEEQGVVEEITKLCSFENLKKLEVNKNGHVYGILKKSSYFRKGEVVDWMNYLTPAMAERMDKLIETKFKGSGLVFTRSKAMKN
ncbi:hypothetical protein ABFS82_07G081700 [Erythranthe guttata]